MNENISTNTLGKEIPTGFVYEIPCDQLHQLAEFLLVHKHLLFEELQETYATELQLWLFRLEKGAP